MVLWAREQRAVVAEIPHVFVMGDDIRIQHTLEGSGSIAGMTFAFNSALEDDPSLSLPAPSSITIVDAATRRVELYWNPTASLTFPAPASGEELGLRAALVELVTTLAGAVASYGPSRLRYRNRI